MTNQLMMAKDLLRVKLHKSFSLFWPEITDRPPSVSGAIVDWNLGINLLLFVEEKQMNNRVAIICAKVQISMQMFQ